MANVASRFARRRRSFAERTTTMTARSGTSGPIPRPMPIRTRGPITQRTDGRCRLSLREKKTFVRGANDDTDCTIWHVWADSPADADSLAKTDYAVDMAQQGILSSRIMQQSREFCRSFKVRATGETGDLGRHRSVAARRRSTRRSVFTLVTGDRRRFIGARCRRADARRLNGKQFAAEHIKRCYFDIFFKII